MNYPQGNVVSNTVKRKYPRSQAIDVARELLPALQRVAIQLVVAGSLRRKKQQVGDIEILYIPKTETVKEGFWDTREINQFDNALDSLLNSGIIAKRPNQIGSVVWGTKNKPARHCATGIPIDFFAATPENWWNYLVCRTGGAENNIRICQAAQAKGWKWHPTEAGFTDEEGNIVPVHSEQAVFQLAGLPYLTPDKR